MSVTIATRRTPVRPVRVDLPCAKCWVGNMQVDRTSAVRTSWPPQYRLACSQGCGYVAWSTTRYPYIDYEEIVEAGDVR